MSEQEKSKGVVIFAFNTKEIDYQTIAVNAARLAKATLGIPVTLITDQSIDNSVFDQVVIVDNEFENHRTGYEQGTTWRNGNRYLAYALSPYQTTILIDSDYLILDQSLLKIAQTTQDYAIFYDNNSLSQPYENSMGINSLPFVWATAVVFNKTPKAQALFSMVGRVQRNYSYYRKLFNVRDINFRNDYAFAIANWILNGYAITRENAIPWRLTTVDYLVESVELHKTQVVVRGNNTATVFPQQNLHIMDKKFLNSECYQRFVDTVCQD